MQLSKYMDSLLTMENNHHHTAQTTSEQQLWGTCAIVELVQRTATLIIVCGN